MMQLKKISIPWPKVNVGLSGLIILLGVVSFTSGSDALSKASLKEQISNTGLLADGPEELLFVSTLDGALHAVTKSTGTKKWSLKEEPVIHNPDSSEEPPVPRFFPNPQDGSLYRYTAGRGSEPLKKLPFTIQELVANSPCRSNDGIFYIGKKVDSWVGVDSVTGKKQLVLGADAVEKVCPKQSRHTIYLGRTLYNIVLFELNTGHKWNVSFYHYTTSSTPLKNYNLVHYSATGEGAILTVDQKTGTPLWNLDLDSPVIALYILDSDSTFVSVPLTTVTPQTLQRFSSNLQELSQIEADDDNSDDLLIKELSPTIFVGETKYGVYALPAFVDTNTARISRRKSQLLLGGPPGQRATMGSAKQESQNNNEAADVLLLGYYDIPESLKSELKKVSAKEIGAFEDASLPLGITHKGNKTTRPSMDSSDEGDVSVHVFWYGIRQILHFNVSFVASGDMVRWSFQLTRLSMAWLISDPLNFLVATLTACLLFILVLLYKQAQEYARLSREVSSRRNTSSRGSSGGSSHNEVTAVAEELDCGAIKVGKITFTPQDLLGKGCDGTFVFRGSFDGRSVAVKRVLPECFSIADREVDLLRESDQHPNVIRYFCMEQCREFRYIALELCTATLEDYVNGRIDNSISPLTILRQATAGLYHLHSLDIVHRDIKPHNVLLSFPNSKGEVRAMISDFGLCKRLEMGRMSFSKKSGVTGTEGWIAPEMITTGRPTSKVDIFSLGCVFYYVLTNGKHPFGSILDRQSKIISGKYSLEALENEEDVLPRTLIEKMISGRSSERPPTKAVLMHPLFWSADRILQFFQEVSDRVETEGGNSLVMLNLEWGNAGVVRDDWTRHMHPVIGEDLRRYREYKGRSVKDLLRALRNKKNHYRELTEDARRVFGRIPEDFVLYWTLKFPRLLLHTWYALQCCKLEPIFSKYYYPGFNFKPEEDEDADCNDNLHELVSLSPNNRPSASGSSNSRGGSSPSREKKRDEYSLLDSLLGPAIPRKGLRNPPKHTDSGPGTWVIRKPVNTFEPQFKRNVPLLASAEIKENESKDDFDAADERDESQGPKQSEELPMLSEDRGLPTPNYRLEELPQKSERCSSPNPQKDHSLSIIKEDVTLQEIFDKNVAPRNNNKENIPAQIYIKKNSPPSEKTNGLRIPINSQEGNTEQNLDKTDLTKDLSTKLVKENKLGDILSIKEKKRNKKKKNDDKS